MGNLDAPKQSSTNENFSRVLLARDELDELLASMSGGRSNFGLLNVGQLSEALMGIKEEVTREDGYHNFRKHEEFLCDLIRQYKSLCQVPRRNQQIVSSLLSLIELYRDAFMKEAKSLLEARLHCRDTAELFHAGVQIINMKLTVGEIWSQVKQNDLSGVFLEEQNKDSSPVSTLHSSFAAMTLVVSELFKTAEKMEVAYSLKDLLRLIEDYLEAMVGITDNAGAIVNAVANIRLLYHSEWLQGGFKTLLSSLEHMALRMALYDRALFCL